MISSTKLSVDEAADLLKVNSVTVYRSIRNGSLPAIRSGKSYTIILNDLIEYINSAKSLRRNHGRVTTKKAKPFLKWAGGKRQLVEKLSERIPNEISGTYYEPFLGGGALYFYLQPKKAKLSDSNAELINVYQVVRDNVESLIDHLAVHRNNEKYYYDTRAVDPDSLDTIERASRTIFLNRTCFNGLYRVNRKGFFNVPYGKKKGDFTFDAENLRLASSSLANADIYVQDYKDSLKGVRKNDFVYLDPPYYPVGGFSDFQRYTKECFSEHDHDDLFGIFDRLSNRDVSIIQSNSNTDFIKDKYGKYQIEVIDAKRLISSKAESRNSKDVIIYSSSLYANK